MRFGQYQFFCRLETDAELPHYKGSTFRGVFGRALKKVVCALKHQECENCLLREKCVYAQVFELPATGNHPSARMAAPPHPFVIEPPTTGQRYFPAGRTFDFTLLLLGETNTFLPYFIYAFDQMGKIGIGKKINGNRGRFSLETVTHKNDVIYSSEDQKLTNEKPLSDLVLDRPLLLDASPCAIRVTLETPLRLKFENKLQADLPFHILVRAMLRRMSSLMNAFADGEPNLDYRGLVKKAESVEIKENNLAWFDWQRYSARQDKKMLMGGMTGDVTYAGDIGDYLPLIQFCEKVHLGKQTTFGLGKIKTEMI